MTQNIKFKLLQVILMITSIIPLTSCGDNSSGGSSVTYPPAVTTTVENKNWIPTQVVPSITQADLDAMDAQKTVMDNFINQGRNRWSSANLTPVFNLLKTQWDAIPGTGTYKEYVTAADVSYDGKGIYETNPIYKGGKFQEGEVLGAHSKEVLTHWLKLYNFLKTVAHAPMNGYSQFKQAAASASSWTSAKGLGGGHYPTIEAATAIGLPENYYQLTYIGRSNSNLYGATEWNDLTKYPTLTETAVVKDDRIFMEAMLKIWNEGEGNSIKELGHRVAFLISNPLIGLSTIPNFRSYMVFGGEYKKLDPFKSNPNLDYASLDKDPNSLELIKKYDAQKLNACIKAMWPGELVPTVALVKNRHQSFSIELNKNCYTITTGTTNVKLQLFKGATIGALAQEGNDLDISATPTANAKGIYNKYIKNGVDVTSLDQITFDDADASNVTGGHFFEVRGNSAYLAFRVPFEWFYKIYTEYNKVSPTTFYQIRATFDIAPTATPDPRQAGGTNSEFRWTFVDLDKQTAIP